MNKTVSKILRRASTIDSGDRKGEIDKNMLKELKKLWINTPRTIRKRIDNRASNKNNITSKE